MSSVLLLPLEHDQSVSTPNEQKSTVGLHQTPDKRKTASPSTSLSPRKVLLRRKVKALKQKLKRRDCKLRSMKELISNLKNKFKAPDSLIEIVENNFTGLPFELLLSSLKNKGKSKNKHTFTESVKEFALTLYFYSPKAYRYLRASNLILPHPATLRKWISKFNCCPGFLEEVFMYLRHNVKEQEHLRNVSLVFDSMSIRKQIVYDEQLGKNVGYVDVGGFKIDNNEEIATEALVFQIVSLRGHFKCIVGYFYVNKTSSVFLSQLIKVAIVKLSEVGVNVQSVTFDGTSTNLSALKHLGCKFPEAPFFKLDTMNYDICAILDPPHMLKLARNALADIKVIDSESGRICFKYIEDLNNLQNKLGLKMCNKLSDKHVLYKNRKMNVKVAAQTISSSVADALQYLNIKEHPQFSDSDCLATVEFLRIVDNLFDFMNSRDPFGRGYKGPMKLENKANDDLMLKKADNYLSKLKIGGQSILNHARKTFALGFLSNIKSFCILRDRLLVLEDFKYLLSYKFSQDHLELFFSCIRSRGGNNDNPNTKQFTWAVRQLMFRNSVRASENSNCLEFDPNSHLGLLELGHGLCVVDDIDDESEIESAICVMENYDDSSFKDEILYYICGVIVRRMEKQIKCKDCCYVLHANDSDLRTYTRLTDFKSKGKLIRSSEDVLKVVKYAYLLKLSETNLTTVNLTMRVCNHLTGSVFKGHLSNDEFTGSHELLLIKSVTQLFLKIISHHIAKQKTLHVTKKSNLGIRQKLNKMILFSNT
ncbi:THAP domain containing 9 [Homalodisca vitripennis]|nr:THAP domain containing 9 [Homalodisca vitripennis]